MTRLEKWKKDKIEQTKTREVKYRTRLEEWKQNKIGRIKGMDAQEAAKAIYYTGESTPSHGCAKCKGKLRSADECISHIERWLNEEVEESNGK